MLMSYFQRMRLHCGIESVYTLRTQKKIKCLNADGFCGHCNTVFGAMGCFCHYCPCQEGRSVLTGEDIQLGTKTAKWMNWQNSIWKRKIFLLSECGSEIGGNSTRLMCQWSNTWENHSHTSVLCVRTNSWTSALFGYVQCGINVPEHLREHIANFAPFFKNTNVCRGDIGALMQEYAEKEGVMTRARRILISSFELTNGAIITHLQLFYLELGLVCRKV